MMNSNLMLAIGLPTILALSVMAWRRARALSARIEEYRRSMETNPQPPYLALAELLEDRNSVDRPNRKSKKPSQAKR